MDLYVIKYLRGVDWHEEIVGYYTDLEKARSDLASLGATLREPKDMWYYAGFYYKKVDINEIFRPDYIKDYKEFYKGR